MNILLLPEQVLPEQTTYQESYIIEDKAQVSHIINVLKLRVGDTIKVGCKQGTLGQAIIDDIDIDRGCITIQNIDCVHLPPEKLALTVILALPRPKVLRRLIIDMTAIGVRHIVLVNSYRTEKSYWQSPMLRRIDDFITEGLQQGIDTIAPDVSFKKRFKPFVEDELDILTQSQSAIVAHPHANHSFSSYISAHGQPEIVCIGAEGGWIDYEVDLLTAHGCQAVNIGQRILRTEAAVNALCGRYL